VSAVAVVIDDSPDTAASVADELPSVDAGETTSQPPDLEVSTDAGDASTDGDEPGV
jgi:hypothetical protein